MSNPNQTPAPTAAETLIPCPLCGGEAAVNHCGMATDEIKCLACGCSIKFKKPGWTMVMRIAKLTEIWNTRAALSPREEAPAEAAPQPAFYCNGCQDMAY